MKTSLIIVILSFFVLIGCRNYQNDMIDWTSSIPIGTELSSVKAKQPEYLKIDWASPDSLDNNRIIFLITEIKGFNDPLGMSYYLEFQNNGYQGLNSHK